MPAGMRKTPAELRAIIQKGGSVTLGGELYHRGNPLPSDEEIKRVYQAQDDAASGDRSRIVASVIEGLERRERQNDAMIPPELRLAHGEPATDAEKPLRARRPRKPKNAGEGAAEATKPEEVEAPDDAEAEGGDDETQADGDDGPDRPGIDPGGF